MASGLDTDTHARLHLTMSSIVPEYYRQFPQGPPKWRVWFRELERAAHDDPGLPGFLIKESSDHQPTQRHRSALIWKHVETMVRDLCGDVNHVSNPTGLLRDVEKALTPTKSQPEEGARREVGWSPRSLEIHLEKMQPLLVAEPDPKQRNRKVHKALLRRSVREERADLLESWTEMAEGLERRTIRYHGSDAVTAGALPLMDADYVADVVRFRRACELAIQHLLPVKAATSPLGRSSVQEMFREHLDLLTTFHANLSFLAWWHWFHGRRDDKSRNAILDRHYGRNLTAERVVEAFRWLHKLHGSPYKAAYHLENSGHALLELQAPDPLGAYNCWAVASCVPSLPRGERATTAILAARISRRVGSEIVASGEDGEHWLKAAANWLDAADEFRGDEVDPEVMANLALERAELALLHGQDVEGLRLAESAVGFAEGMPPDSVYAIFLLTWSAGVTDAAGASVRAREILVRGRARAQDTGLQAPPLEILGRRTRARQESKQPGV